MENNIDIVYILGDGSRWNNNEIRYSLRSLEKNFEHRKVFIIGEKPEWITNVIHIPIIDGKSNENGIKLLNAKRKYLTAATDMRISKDFVLMNDDFFFLEKMENISNYSRGTLSEMIKRHPTKGGYYYRSLMDTRHRLSTMGIEEPIDFEVHAPIIFNKEKLSEVIGMIGQDKTYSFRSCYGNLMRLESETIMDFKAANLLEFTIQTRKDREFLSINDALVACKEFREWIQIKFPKPSKYELDLGNGTKVAPGRPMGALKYIATKGFTYGQRTFSQGSIIDGNTMTQIKNTPKMRDMWELK